MIVLIGFMGAGKSTVGPLLAHRLGLPFLDTDTLIEERSGKDVEELFASEGEAAFRALEREVVKEVLSGPAAVVALGGGAPCHDETRQALEGSFVAFLDLPYEEMKRRTGTGAERPLLRMRDPRALWLERRPLYVASASRTFRVGGSTPDEVAAAIEQAVRSAPRGHPPGTFRVQVPLAPRPYEVLIGAGIMSQLGALTEELGRGRFFLVTHPGLEALAAPVRRALEGAGRSVHVLTTPEGERAKTLEQAGYLLSGLAGVPARRGDVVVAVGGGVVTDLAGFVASIYARGLQVVHVPTTLLAQLDAAIGGKTGVNLPEGKNLAGTFHQPSLVICDVELLRSLPEAEMRSGLGEAVKYGLIADPSLLDLLGARVEEVLRADPLILSEIVYRSAAIKAGIVVRDERDEGGIRAWLNYGHTVGHAIEQARGFAGIRHGEAVGLGMIVAAFLAEQVGWLDAEAVELHRRSLSGVGLPVSATLRLEELQPAWLRDKKHDDRLRFVLLEGIGHPRAGIEVGNEQLKLALERIAS